MWGGGPGGRVTSFRRLSYVRGGQVNAAGMNLDGLPLSVEGCDRRLGRLAGLVIDVADRRVRYLVVASSETGREHLLPLDSTSIDPQRGLVAHLSGNTLAACEPFDASAFAEYDDEAMMSLMFGAPAA